MVEAAILALSGRRRISRAAPLLVILQATD